MGESAGERAGRRAGEEKLPSGISLPRITRWVLTRSKRQVLYTVLLAMFAFSVCLSFGVRYGPVSHQVGQAAQEGMRDHFCGLDGQVGKLEFSLISGEDLRAPDDLLRPFGMVVIDGKLLNHYQARLGWDVQWGQSSIIGTSSPTWYHSRWYCITNTTKTVQLQIWDDNIITSNTFLASVDLNATFLSATKQDGKEGLFNTLGTYELKDENGNYGGQVTVATRFYPSKDLSELHPYLETGDVILFSGATINGNFIKATTKSEWSHVGLVWREAETGALRMIESSTNHAHLHDCDELKPHWGTEKVSLHDKIYSSFYDKVAIRRLMLPGGKEARAQLHEELTGFYESKKGASYEEFKIEMIKAYFDWNSPDNFNARVTLFCSEFVAQAFISVGLLNQKTVPSNVMQYEFSSESNKAPIQGGAYLQNEVYLRDVQRYPLGFCFEFPDQCGCGIQEFGYSESFACILPPCGSIWHLVWGGGIDLGLGFPLEIAISALGLAWLLAVIMANIFICFYLVVYAKSRKSLLMQHLRARAHKTVYRPHKSLEEEGGGRRRRRFCLFFLAGKAGGGPCVQGVGCARGSR